MAVAKNLELRQGSKRKLSSDEQDEIANRLSQISREDIKRLLLYTEVLRDIRSEAISRIKSRRNKSKLRTRTK